MTRTRTLSAAMFLSLALCNSASAALFDFVSGGPPAYDAKVKTAWLVQIDAKGRYSKPYEPDKKALAPFAKAQLGAQTAFSIVNGANFAHAPEAQAISQSVVDAILAGWKGPKPVIPVLIAADASYGAEANKTGQIVVNIGSFNPDPSKGVQSEDELALMLGHEVAHILLAHLKDQDMMNTAVNSMTTAAVWYMAYSSISDSRIVNGQLSLQANNDMMMRGAVAGLVATALVGDLLAPNWGSAQESEADRLGVDLARRAGFLVSDDEVRQFVEKHSQAQEFRATRIEHIKTLSQLMIANARATPQTGNGYLDAGIGTAVTQGGTELLNRLAAGVESLTVDHPDRAKREADLVAYATAVYGDNETDASGRLLRRHASEVKTVSQAPGIHGTVNSAVAAAKVQDAMVAQVTSNLQKTTSTASTATVAADAPPLPSPCGPVAAPVQAQAPAKAQPARRRGAKTAAPSAAPAPVPVATPAIDTGFPVDAAPVTWTVRGDWQSGSVACKARAPEDWLRAAQSDYGSLSTLHSLTTALAGTPRAGQLAGLYDRYVGALGSDADFPDLAVAVARTNGDDARAEVKAAECYSYQHHSLYPVCARLLGYDPVADTNAAKTPEGKKAFADAKSGSTFDDLTKGARGFFQ